MTAPIRVLAEDHFGGSLAVICALVTTLLPFVYLGGVLVVRVVRSRADRARDRSDSNLALGVGAVAAIAFGIALVPFWARYAGGETLIGEVVSVEQRRRSDTDVRVFSIRLPDGRTFEERVENEDIAKMSTGTRVFVRGVSGLPGLERLGDEATLGEGAAIGSVLVWAVLGCVTIALGRRR